MTHPVTRAAGQAEANQQPSPQDSPCALGDYQLPDLQRLLVGIHGWQQEALALRIEAISGRSATQILGGSVVAGPAALVSLGVGAGGFALSGVAASKFLRDGAVPELLSIGALPAVSALSVGLSFEMFQRFWSGAVDSMKLAIHPLRDVNAARVRLERGAASPPALYSTRGVCSALASVVGGVLTLCSVAGVAITQKLPPIVTTAGTPMSPLSQGVLWPSLGGMVTAFGLVVVVDGLSRLRREMQLRRAVRNLHPREAAELDRSIQKLQSSSGAELSARP